MPERGRRRFSYSFLVCPSFALVSPEPDDSMREANWRLGGSEAYVQVRSMVMRTKSEKKISHMNKSSGDIPA